MRRKCQEELRCFHVLGWTPRRQEPLVLAG